MQTIEIRHPYNHDHIPAEQVVLVLVLLEGVHKGHQKVIETGRKIGQ